MHVNSRSDFLSTSQGDRIGCLARDKGLRIHINAAQKRTGGYPAAERVEEYKDSESWYMSIVPPRYAKL
jgi:hypothetical protein